MLLLKELRENPMNITTATTQQLRNAGHTVTVLRPAKKHYRNSQLSGTRFKGATNNLKNAPKGA